MKELIIALLILILATFMHALGLYVGSISMKNMDIEISKGVNVTFEGHKMIFSVKEK